MVWYHLLELQRDREVFPPSSLYLLSSYYQFCFKYISERLMIYDGNDYDQSIVEMTRKT